MTAADKGSLRDLQSQFSRFLAGAAHRMGDYVVGDAALGADARLAIYASAYRLRLREALETDHDVLWQYLGDALFDRLVAGYIDATPSGHTSLRHYGNALPAYLAATLPFRAHPVLAELAAFERLLMDVFDARDSARCDPGDLLLQPAAVWPSLKLRLHPSVRLFAARMNSVEIWKALRAGTEPPAVAGQAIHWLLWRGTERLSEFRPLSNDEQALLAGALEGADFAWLCERLNDFIPGDAVAPAFVDYLGQWLEQGLVTALEAPAR